MSINYPEHINLAQIPTPIQPAHNLSRAFEGPEIFIKRDDLTGIGCTGNKIRKCEFLMAEAKAESADIVITCGGVQSNHCRTVAFAATKLGMQSHLVLKGSRSAHVDGNLFICRLVDAEISFVTDEEYADVMNYMANLKSKYAAQGKKAYVIPEGGSNAIGAWGYVKGMEEILFQLKQQNLKIDTIFCAVGSGGTYAGYLIGASLLDAPVEVMGVNVCDTAEFFEDAVHKIAADFTAKYGYKLPDIDRRMKIVDGFVGKGYGLSSQDEITTIKQAAKLEGLLLDPVYTGKAMNALRVLIQRGEIEKDRRVLFLHSGGVFGLFPKKNLFF